MRGVKGMKDLLGKDLVLHHHVRNQAREVFSAHNFREIETNLVEEREVFERSLGQGSDVITKEMFMVGRGEQNMVLRPENTAGVMRHLLEKGGYRHGVQKLFYCGKMFRYERP